MKKLLLISVILTLCVVVFGAYVRLTDAGLGCPDWPGCYGTLTVPESMEAIAEAQKIYPNSPVESTKAWIEMIHRYLAGILGILILIIGFTSYKKRQEIAVPVALPIFLVLLLFMQAALGMWTVTMLLQPAIVTLHLLGGMSILGILSFITHNRYHLFFSMTIHKQHIKPKIRLGQIILSILL